jgi:hypothetical protein
MKRELNINTAPLAGILKKGQAGFLGGVFKIGDGVKSWAALPAIQFGNGAPVNYGNQMFEYKENSIVLTIQVGQIYSPQVEINQLFNNEYDVILKRDVVLEVISGIPLSDTLALVSYSSAAGGIVNRKQLKQNYFAVSLRYASKFSSQTYPNPAAEIITTKLTLKQIALL